MEQQRALLQLHCMNVIVDDAGGESLGMRLHVLHQCRPLQPFGAAGPVVYICGGGQLSARLMTGNQHRLQIGAGRIKRCGPAGGAGAEDNQLVMNNFCRHYEFQC